MDLKVVILICLFAFLMVAMGDNPFAMPPLPKEVKDEFTYSMKEQLDKEKKDGGKLNTYFAYQHNANPMKDGPISGPQGTGYTPGASGMSMQPLTQPGMAGAPSPSMQMPQPNWQAASQNQAAAIASQPAPQPTAETGSGETGSGFYLKDGQQIFFFGFKVFTKSDTGELVPLPDGTYELQTGDAIFIKNGRRQSNPQL